MPRSISLAAYAVKVWSVEEKQDKQVSRFADNADLLEFFDRFLSTVKSSTLHDKDFQQVLRVQKLKKEKRRIYGVIETGEYGQESTLWDVEKKSVAHERKTTEADMLPFYFLLDIPEGPDEAVLLLQRLGMFGIRQVLHQALDRKFQERFPDYRLRLNPLVEAKEIEKYTKGKIESIRFVHFGIPSDIAEAFDSGHKEIEGRVELVVHARRGSSLPLTDKLRQFLKGDKELGKLIALDDSGFEYENIKVKSRVGRTSRTVDLANLKHLRSYYDVTDSVRVDRGSGHPQFDSIHSIASDLADRLKDDLYGS
jgi:hypothetical protein